MENESRKFSRWFIAYSALPVLYFLLAFVGCLFPSGYCDLTQGFMLGIISVIPLIYLLIVFLIVSRRKGLNPIAWLVLNIPIAYIFILLNSYIGNASDMTLTYTFLLSIYKYAGFALFLMATYLKFRDYYMSKK